MGSADCDGDGTTGHSRLDTRGRVLEDEALLDGVSKLFGSEEERVGERLASKETGIVCGDGDSRTGDSSAEEGSMAVCSGVSYNRGGGQREKGRTGFGTRGCDGESTLGKRIDEATNTR